MARWFRWGFGREEWSGSISEVRGSSPGGCSGAGMVGVSCPRRAGGSPEWRKGAAVVFEARGAGREKGSAEWNGHELEKLESRRIEARRGCLARATTAASCRPGGIRIGVARGGKGQQGRARAAAAGVQVTRGGGWKQEVVLEVLQRAAQRRQGACSAPAARGKQSRAEAPEEEEEGRGFEGSVSKNRKVQGLSCKVKFSTDLNFK
jgi:hypothetical protein